MCFLRFGFALLSLVFSLTAKAEPAFVKTPDGHYKTTAFESPISKPVEVGGVKFEKATVINGDFYIPPSKGESPDYWLFAGRNETSKGNRDHYTVCLHDNMCTTVNPELCTELTGHLLNAGVDAVRCAYYMTSMQKSFNKYKDLTAVNPKDMEEIQKFHKDLTGKDLRLRKDPALNQRLANAHDMNIAHMFFIGQACWSLQSFDNIYMGHRMANPPKPVMPTDPMLEPFPEPEESSGSPGLGTPTRQ